MTGPSPDDTRPHLAREMGLIGLIATALCAMVGVGINIIPFMVQRSAPGVGAAIPWVYVVAAVPATLAALCYAILSSAMPRAGGSYIYATRALNPFVGFLGSFAQWFGLSMGMGVVAYLMVPYAPAVMAPLVVAPERAFAGKQLRNGVFYLGWLAETPESDDLAFTERTLRAGTSLLPALADLPVRRVLGGWYDTTPDRRPILGRVLGPRGGAGLFVAAGFSGHGFMIAPAVGELLAAAVTDQPCGLPAGSFALDRFAESGSPEGLVI